MLSAISRSNLNRKGRTNTLNSNIDRDNNFSIKWRFISNLYSLRINELEFISFNRKLYYRSKIYDNINGDDNIFIIRYINNICNRRNNKFKCNGSKFNWNMANLLGSIIRFRFIPFSSINSRII